MTANNEAVEAAPSLINTSAMDEGWLFKVSLSKLEEVDELMNQEAYEKVIEEVVEILEIDKFYLVGHSMGGMIAQIIAANHSERI